MYKLKWNSKEQSPATMQMSLERITLSEGSHCGHGLGEFVYSECPEQANPQRQKAGYWLPGPGGGVEWGELLNGSRISFLGDRIVLELDRGAGCTIL